MKIENLLAKGLKEGRKPITLKQHLTSVAERAHRFAVEITDNEMIQWLVYVSALLHDVGKCSPDFQEHLKDKNEPYLYHNILGGYIVSNFLDSEVKYTPEEKCISSVIRKIVLFHHPIPFDAEVKIKGYKVDNDYYKTILNEIVEINNSNFKEHKLKVKNIDEPASSLLDIITNIKYYEPNGNYNETDQHIFNLVNSIVKFSDAFLSFGVSEYEILNRKNNININEIEKPSQYDDRFYEQIKHAQNLSNYNNSLFQSPTGFGKTMLGLLYSLSNTKRTFWICPRNTIAQGIYKTLTNEVKALNLEDKISVGLLLTNEYLEGDKNSDIIVTNIDNFLRPIINNDAIEREHPIFSANCIFDEFHEYIMEAPLMALFDIMVRTRSMIKSKTLYLSATPTPVNYFFNNEIHIETCEGVKVIEDKKYIIEFVDNFDSLNPDDLEGSLISVISTARAQEVKKKGIADKVLHARYYNHDRVRLLDDLYNEYGKGNKNGDKKTSWVATNLITTGVDVSFKNLITIVPLPDRLIQTIGRCNRWGENNGVSKIILLPHDKKSNSERFAASKQRINNIIPKFYEFLKYKFKNNQEVTLKELYDARNEFYIKEEMVMRTEYFKGMRTRSFKSLDKIQYKMGYKLDDNNLEYVGSNVLRDNGSKNFYCILTNKNGGIIDSDDLFVSNTQMIDIEKITDENSDIYKAYEKFYSREELCNAYFGKKHRFNGINKKGKLVTTLLSMAMNKKTPIHILPEIAYYSPELGLVKRKI